MWEKPFKAQYRFMRVKRTGEEVGEIKGIVDRTGSISRNIDSQTFESATVSFAGEIPSFGSDLIRIYLEADFMDGTKETVALGTFIPNVPSSTKDGKTVTGTINMDGRLKELSSTSFLEPITIAAGQSAVDEARNIAEACGLSVVSDDSDYQLTSAWTLGMRDGSSTPSKLDDINALLDVAGFSACRTDAMGNVVMRKYTPPSERSAAYSYTEGKNARFLREITDEFDSTNVANVVKVIFSTQDAEVIGIARNDDPNDPYSTVGIGYERVAEYSYDSIVSQDEADAKAKTLLESQQIVRKIVLQHVWDGSGCDEMAQVDYPSADVSGMFNARTQDIGLDDGCLVKVELRAYEGA